MKRLRTTRPPPWSTTFKARDKREKPKYTKNCKRCNTPLIGTRKEMAATVYCSAACVPAPLAERWDNLVEYTDGCWLWSGATNAEGYGVIREGDRMVLAHRVSLRLKLDVPDFDGFACHTCNNRRCVNPAHLYIGTHEDNMRDMSVDNTGSGSKTDWETRRQMVLDFYTSGDIATVAAAYGVSKKTVRRWVAAMGPDAVIPRPRRSPFADASSD